jgi:serine protease Do
MRRLLLLLAFIPTSALGQDHSFSREAQIIDQAMEEAVRKAEPAVVSILVSRSEDYQRLLKDSPPSDRPGVLGAFDRNQAKKTLSETIKDSHRLDAILRRLDLSDPEYVPESYGSGVAISAQGSILTNFHVVRDAAKIYVRHPGGKGSYANIYAGDARSDLAVLRLLDSKAQPVPFLRPGNGQVRKGQLILTLTNPYAPGFRDASPRASWGIVSNLRQKNPHRPLLQELDRWTLHHYGTLIQTDRSLPVGSSGGVVLNLEGEIVGLVTSLAGVTGDPGGAYAVPIDASMARIIGIMEKGKEVEYGFLGVSWPQFRRGFQGNMMDEDTRSERGVPIGISIPGSPAASAGLQTGDYIVAVNDVPVHERDDLILAISSALAGSTVRLKVLRNWGEAKLVSVTVVKDYQAAQSIASVKHPFARGIRVDYTSVLVRGGRRQEIQPGVLVRDVDKGSQAESAHLQDAIIVMVDGQEVNTPSEFYEKMRKVGSVELTLAGADEHNQMQRVTLD